MLNQHSNQAPRASLVFVVSIQRNQRGYPRQNCTHPKNYICRPISAICRHLLCFSSTLIKQLPPLQSERNHMKIQRYIVTSTPSAGKTTLLHALSQQGIPFIPESATHLIHTLQSQGIEKPWENKSFIVKLTRHQLNQQTATSFSPVMLYDRSIFCTYALCLFLRLPIPNMLHTAIHRPLQQNTFEKTVFFIENLGFVQHTKARTIAFHSALEFEALHRFVYKLFDFQICAIPKNTLPNRVTQMKLHLNLQQSPTPLV